MQFINSFIYYMLAGLCLFLTKRSYGLDSFDCTGFHQGCPTEHYRGSTIYKCKFAFNHKTSESRNDFNISN